MANVNPAIPDAPTKPTDRPGHEYDPYGAANQFADIHPPHIPFHNYRQIHVSEIAWGEGIQAPSVKEIPKCPPLWGDVGHYWIIVAFAAWIFYEYGLNSKGSFLIRIFEVVGSAGAFALFQKFVLVPAGIVI